MKITLVGIGLIALSLAACNIPDPNIKSNGQKLNDNGTAFVEYLFEVDGCKVYRFYDHDHYHYLSTCRGSETMTTQSYRAGKSTRYFSDEIKTE